MKSMSGKELAKLVEAEDWILLRIQGSHHIYGKAGYSERLSIPIHGNKPIKIGLLRHLLKTAGLLESVEPQPKKLIAEDRPENKSDSETLDQDS